MKKDKVLNRRYSESHRRGTKRIIKIFLLGIIFISTVGCGSTNTPMQNGSSATTKSQVERSNKESSDGKQAVSADNESGEQLESKNTNVTKDINNIETEYKIVEAEEDDGLTEQQRNAINMLNYMMVLTQEINDSKESRLYLEFVYASLINNSYPNAVDMKTETQMTSMLDTLEQYRMITVKRERLEYIYEQNKAQTFRKTIPNPVALLSVVESGSLLKATASVAYMAVDASSNYKSANAQADLQYLQDGWELDDTEAEELHKSRKNMFSYMLNMVRDNALPVIMC